MMFDIVCFNFFLLFFFGPNIEIPTQRMTRYSYMFDESQLYLSSAQRRMYADIRTRWKEERKKVHQVSDTLYGKF